MTTLDKGGILPTMRLLCASLQTNKGLAVHCVFLTLLSCMADLPYHSPKLDYQNTVSGLVDQNSTFHRVVKGGWPERRKMSLFFLLVVSLCKMPTIYPQNHVFKRQTYSNISVKKKIKINIYIDKQIWASGITLQYTHKHSGLASTMRWHLSDMTAHLTTGYSMKATWCCALKDQCVMTKQIHEVKVTVPCGSQSYSKPNLVRDSGNQHDYK